MKWYIILKEYFEIILNWPFLGAGLILYFLLAYKEEIRKILPTVKKIGSTEFGQIQSEKLEISAASSSSSTNWEFKYYGKVLVQQTAISLLWLYNTGSSTEQNFRNNMSYSQATQDIPGEKEAQFSVLLNYNFIEKIGELYKVSPKGVELLKFYGFIT